MYIYWDEKVGEKQFHSTLDIARLYVGCFLNGTQIDFKRDKMWETQKVEWEFLFDV